MAISDKTFLLVSDDDAAIDVVKTAIEPLVKTIVCVKTAHDAITKATRVNFDCFILRTQKTSMKDPRHFFQWSQTQKNSKATPWVVLGKDIEDAAFMAAQPRVKHTDHFDDGAGLLNIINAVFYTPPVEAPPAPSTPMSAFNVTFINPLIGAVVEVLKAKAKIDLKRGMPFIRKPSDKAIGVGDIAGVITLNSERSMGSLAISFDQNLILKIYENMRGAKTPAINPDVKRAVSELTTSILDNAKVGLGAAGHLLGPASADVVTGAGVRTPQSSAESCFCIPFESPHGKVQMECVVTLKK